MQKFPMTPDGHKKLKAELADLLHRPTVIVGYARVADGVVGLLP